MRATCSPTRTADLVVALDVRAFVCIFCSMATPALDAFADETGGLPAVTEAARWAIAGDIAVHWMTIRDRQNGAALLSAVQPTWWKVATK